MRLRRDSRDTYGVTDARRRCSSAWAWALAAVGLLMASHAEAQEDLDLNPARPTIANSASVQHKGVLQIDTGYDAYPQMRPGNQQAVDTAVSYTPWEKVRLDFDWTEFAYTHDADQHARGVGTVQIGTRIILVKDRRHRWLPGIGIQYEAELPAASDEALNGYGQQAILLVNHHLGRFNVIVNGSVVQTNCQTNAGCSVGGQQAIALAYHPSKRTSIYAEAFAQNVSQSNTPPGTYVFAGFLHRFSDSFGVDGGVRFGVSDGSASIGTTVGFFFGKRLRPVR
jgi:hypothetical protein